MDWKSRLFSPKLIEWSKQESMLENALDLFIEDRVSNIIVKLRKILSGIHFEVIDTRASV